VTDLVVLSHLPWTWVWQRPQHLISRLSALWDRTWFVEEPVRAEASIAGLGTEQLAPETARVWLEVPDPLAYTSSLDPQTRLRYGAPGTECYADLLAKLVGEDVDVWLYAPMAIELACSLRPRRLIYDVMDDLACFARAPEGLREQHRRALALADVVFTGGPSLQRLVSAERASPATYLFRSGVDTAHYARSRRLPGPEGDRPVAGYVGVIDERLDLELIDALARALPEWQLRLAGPVSKVDPDQLPDAPNISYLGIQPYERLPEIMAGLDVALMPFALNEATRSISPTKTLEYLAAGLPVVSTRVPDVVEDYPGVVHFADTAEEFAAACVTARQESRRLRDRRVAPLARVQEWDAIAAGMAEILDDRSAPSSDIDRNGTLTQS
jgi:glycosyltransferase involved in cell wall biosynthesis